MRRLPPEDDGIRLDGTQPAEDHGHHTRLLGFSLMGGSPFRRTRVRPRQTMMARAALALLSRREQRTTSPFVGVLGLAIRRPDRIGPRR